MLKMKDTITDSTSVYVGIGFCALLILALWCIIYRYHRIDLELPIYDVELEALPPYAKFENLV